MYVCEWDMCWRNFCNFSLVTTKCEKWVKIALFFSNEHHFEIWFPKKRTITFSWSKLFKLHKKDPILHVATTFSLKQGETRTSHGPIPHPLNIWFYEGRVNFSKPKWSFNNFNVVFFIYLQLSYWFEYIYANHNNM